MQGQLVNVDDVGVPARPHDELEDLIAYLDGEYGERRRQLTEAMQTARSLKHKQDVIQLGYDALLFRMELDPWLAFAGQLLDQERGNQLSYAHGERSAEAKEQGSRRPDATVVRSQADQITAPLKRAYTELKDTQDLIGRIVSWCQSQQKILAGEEYGELFSSSNQVPEQMFSDPPAASKPLRQMRKVK